MYRYQSKPSNVPGNALEMHFAFLWNAKIPFGGGRGGGHWSCQIVHLLNSAKMWFRNFPLHIKQKLKEIGGGGLQRQGKGVSTVSAVL